MKKSRFSEQQIAFVSRQAEKGTTVEEVCRKMGVSQAATDNGWWPDPGAAAVQNRSL